MTKMRVYLLLLVLLGTLIACSPEEKNPTASNPEIHIGILPDVESFPLLIAQANGYFAEAGVNVHLDQFKSARDRDSALQSGLLDGMVTDMVAVFFANEGGFPLRILTPTDGTIFLLAANNLSAETIADVESKSIGISTNTVMEYTLDTMLGQAGLSADTVNKTAIPQIPTRLEMLQNGQIDFALLPEPWAGLAIQGGAKIIMTTGDVGHKAGVLAFDEQAIAANPDEIKKVLQAYNQAVEYLNEKDSAEYIDILIDQLGFPSETRTTLTLPVYQAAHLPEATTFYSVQSWLKEKDLLLNDWSYEQITAQNILKE